MLQRTTRDGQEFTVTVASDLAGLGREWPGLGDLAGLGAYIFQAREVLEIWLGTIGLARRTRPLFVAVALRDGTPVMMVALGIERRGGVRVLTFLDGGVTDYNAPILFPAGWAIDSATMARIWERIVEALPRFDSAVLEKIPAVVGETANPFALIFTQANNDSAHVLELVGSWQDYVATRMPRARDSRRKRRNLARIGAVGYRVAATQGEHDAILEEMLRHKRRRYIETRGVDGLARPGYLAYFRELTARLAAGGYVHASALFCGDTMVATHWGLMCERRLYSLMPGFAGNQWTRYSPGRLLDEDLIAWCFANDVATLDFGAGDEPYKFEFGAERVAFTRAELARTPVGAIHIGVIRARRRLGASTTGRLIKQAVASVRRALRRLRRGETA